MQSWMTHSRQWHPNVTRSIDSKFSCKRPRSSTGSNGANSQVSGRRSKKGLAVRTGNQDNGSSPREPSETASTGDARHGGDWKTTPPLSLPQGPETKRFSVMLTAVTQIPSGRTNSSQSRRRTPQYFKSEVPEDGTSSKIRHQRGKTRSVNRWHPRRLSKHPWTNAGWYLTGPKDSCNKPHQRGLPIRHQPSTSESRSALLDSYPRSQTK